MTRGEFAAFIADSGHADAGSGWRNPGFNQTDRDPVVCVSAVDAEAFAAWLSGRVGKTYRLPSEAEWEYAARAGTVTTRFWGDGWERGAAYLKIGSRGTSPVGSFKPNGFGLHDMLGNVWEWVADPWHCDYQGAPADGSAWLDGDDSSHRVLRGGSWDTDPRDLRAGIRFSNDANNRNTDVGFRLARTL